jgi:hypothetical protein
VFGPLLLNLIWAIYRLAVSFSGEALVGLVLAFGLMAMFISVRTQILTVQDRVIRLEMRLRLAQVLAAGQQHLIPRLTHKQLVALRFASDGELSQLVQRIADGALKTQKDIKREVKEWQADFLRA